MNIQPYLFFEGRCDEALAFYAKVLGAEVGMLMRYKECPEASEMPPGSADKVMHSSVRIGDSVVMMSDGHCGGAPSFQGFTLSLTTGSVVEARRLFSALSQGGEIRMPIDKTFFSPAFGMLSDKFGARWMIIADPEAVRQSQQPPPEGAFIISRTFDAPRAAVWKAHTEAERLKQWWGPKGCKLDITRFEFRPGGVFHYAMSYSTGARMWGRFVYRDIRSPERIVWINSFANAEGGITRAPFSGDWPLEMENTVTFAEKDGKTDMVVTSVPYGASKDERAYFVGMFDSLRQGFGGTYDQLAEHLAQGA